MKIAICMSGHFRLTHYSSRQNKWFYDLLRNSGNDIDVFLHTWSDKKRVLLTNHLYQFTEIHIDNNPPQTKNYWWGQWISFNRCLGLANKSNKDYDVVIRVRPDNLIFKSDYYDNINVMLDNVVNNNLLLTDSIWGRNEVLYIQDQLFVSRYDVCNTMFGLDNVMSVVSKSKKDKKISPVSTLGYLMQDFDFNNIQVKSGTYLNYFKQKLCRPPHLEIDSQLLKYGQAREIYNNYSKERQQLKENMPKNTYEDWIDE